MALSGKYSVGQPVQYGSIYSYQKFKFPVRDEGGNIIGWAKQERVVDDNGEESGVCYYTRDLPKPHGAKRFYSSPQALIIACGGQIDRTAPNPLVATVNVIKAMADAMPELADEVEDDGSTPEEDAEEQDPGPTPASAASLAEFLTKGPPPQPLDEPGSVKATVEAWAEENGAVAVEPGANLPPEMQSLFAVKPDPVDPIAQKADLAAHAKAAQKSASAKKGVATRAANKLAADKLVQKEARAAAKAKKLKAAKRVAKKLGQ